MLRRDNVYTETDMSWSVHNLNRSDSVMSPTSRLDYERQLGWRVKQIDIGKSTPAYARFASEFPKHRRRRDHPTTPDPYDARMSKRQYEGRVKAWKRSLHELNNDSQACESTPERHEMLNCHIFVTESESEGLMLIPHRVLVMIYDRVNELDHESRFRKYRDSRWMEDHEFSPFIIGKTKSSDVSSPKQTANNHLR